MEVYRMKGKRIVLVMLVLLLGFALIFSGCKKEEKAAEKEAKETEEASTKLLHGQRLYQR